MFLQNFHIFINKRAMLRQKFTVQVTTLPDCDDITRFDGTFKQNIKEQIQNNEKSHRKIHSINLKKKIREPKVERLLLILCYFQ
jgi:hypothetical protein